MQIRQIVSAEQALSVIAERNATHAKVAVTDLDGVLRGKYLTRHKLKSAFNSGLGFCNVILGWDVNDQLYEDVLYTGWHTGYPDAQISLIPETCREIPWEPNVLFFLGEFNGTAKALCPRNLLKRVIQKGISMNLFAKAGAEYEFFLFQETPESVREKNYRDLKPFSPGNFGYSILRSSVSSEFHNSFLEMCQVMDFPIEGYHTETGPGVVEAAIQADEILKAADKAILFKTFTKVFAQRHNLMATFMAKWSMDWPGQSGHIHISLLNQNGDAVFFDPSQKNGISETMRWFIGGQEKLMPELLSMVASTVNSYTRLIPGFWAPTHANWGLENRTCSLRAIAGSEKSQRVEYRVAPADANPYLVMAAALASGLWGIENKIEPNPDVVGNAYDKKFSSHRLLPNSLRESTKALRQSKIARSLFGDEFVDHYSSSREWEQQEFEKHVTDWEMARYFEII